MEAEMSAQNPFVRMATLAFLIAAAVTATAGQPAKQTASEFYMAYRTAFSKANTIEDVLPYMSKGVRAKVEATPAADLPKMFEFIKQMAGSMTNVKVLKETKTDEGVMLTVEGTDGTDKMTGQVQILREGDAWKVGRESWSNKS
jgi:hypothetical protein